MKTCSTCKVEKTLDEFWKSSANKDGHQHNCKECSKKRRREWQQGTAKGLAYSLRTGRIFREKNPDYAREYYRNKVDRTKTSV